MGVEGKNREEYCCWLGVKMTYTYNAGVYLYKGNALAWLVLGLVLIRLLAEGAAGGRAAHKSLR